MKHLICITILSASPKPHSDFMNILRFFQTKSSRPDTMLAIPASTNKPHNYCVFCKYCKPNQTSVRCFQNPRFEPGCFRSQSAPCANLSEWQASTLSSACLFHALYQASDGSLSHHMWNASWHITCLVGHLDTAERTFVTAALASPKLSILFELLRWNCLLWHPDGFEASVSRFAFFLDPLWIVSF